MTLRYSFDVPSRRKETIEFHTVTFGGPYEKAIEVLIKRTRTLKSARIIVESVILMPDEAIAIANQLMQVAEEVKNNRTLTGKPFEEQAND